ncbi:MAG TPA: hypothetical protein VGC22_00470 [Chitinophaga sp.]
MNWNTIVFIIAGLLALLLLVMEWRRQDKARLPWRILATVVAVGALAALALPLRLPAPPAPAAAKVIVLTTGFDPDTVNALYRPHTPVYAADSLAWVKGRRWQAQWMPFPENWAQEGRTVHIVGSGLAAYQRTTGPFIFHPAAVPGGITQINWNQRLPSGATLRIQGRYHRTDNRAVKLLLYGLNAPLDSFLVPATATKNGYYDQLYEPFTLSARPKHSGGAVYRIITLQGKDTLANEPLPVLVTPADTLNVLLLAATPNAEYRFLKDWLGAHGSKVAMRTGISKDRYSQGFMNRDKTAWSLTAATLATYDLVVADAGALQALPAAALSAVAGQVQQGMGLLVKADSGQNTPAFYNRDMALQPAPPAGDQVIQLQAGPPDIAPLHTEQALYIRAGERVQPLLRDDKGHVFGAVQLYGRGRIVTTTLANTYSWLLAAQTDSYERVWSELLQKAGREKPAPDRVYPGTAFPLPHAPVPLFRQSNHPPRDTALAFAPNTSMPFLWQALAWPRHAGWQAVEGGTPWYVYTPGNWQALRSAARLQATAAYVRQHPGVLTETDIRNKGNEGKPVPPLGLFIAFLAAAGFLWLERKL